MDISIHNIVQATSVATFIFESAGILQETENTVLETENISVSSSSNVVETSKTIANPVTHSVERDGPDHAHDAHVPDHQHKSIANVNASIDMHGGGPDGDFGGGNGSGSGGMSGDMGGGPF